MSLIPGPSDRETKTPRGPGGRRDRSRRGDGRLSAPTRDGRGPQAFDGARPFPPGIEHITDEVVVKHVEGSNGEDLGEITAVDGEKAILKPRTGVSAEIEAGISRDDLDRLALEPDQIESVDDETVRLDADF
jgi:hypothetical protein